MSDLLFVVLIVFHYLSLFILAYLSFFPPSVSNLHLKAPLDQASEMSLVLSGFEAGKRNFMQLTDKEGEQPQIASVSHHISSLTGFKKIFY